MSNNCIWSRATIFQFESHYNVNHVLALVCWNVIGRVALNGTPSSLMTRNRLVTACVSNSLGLSGPSDSERGGAIRNGADFARNKSFESSISVRGRQLWLTTAPLSYHRLRLSFKEVAKQMKSGSHPLWCKLFLFNGLRLSKVRYFMSELIVL